MHVGTEEDAIMRIGTERQRTARWRLGLVAVVTLVAVSLAAGTAARKSSPSSSAAVAANCDSVTFAFSRTPSPGVSGPSTAIHTNSAPSTFSP
jgi:hypothetical protein